VRIRQLECIAELAKTGSFSRAAENLSMAQPTLSYQIREAEEEVGFPIFSRSGRGAALTGPGRQFAEALAGILTEYREAVELGQNFASRFREDIRIMMPIRSAIWFLPQAMEQFRGTNPEGSVTPGFDWDRGIDRFLKGESDILFAFRDDVRHVPDIVRHPLFESGIYLVTRLDDPLAKRRSVTEEDFRGRSLMVGGPSQPPLRAVQQRVRERSGCAAFNSESHDMSLTYVASGRGIVLAPGYLNDHSGAFAWIPFACPERIPCVLCTHREDRRPEVKAFVGLIRSFYIGHPEFPV
jgi:DNA-binding transcriptional LysR family regulator